VIETLIFQGNNELQECTENFKTQSHILQFLLLETEKSGPSVVPPKAVEVADPEEEFLKRLVHEHKETFQ